MKAESVCKSWRRLLRDDAPPGVWDRDVVLSGLTEKDAPKDWRNSPFWCSQLYLTRQQTPGFIAPSSWTAAH